MAKSGIMQGLWAGASRLVTGVALGLPLYLAGTWPVMAGAGQPSPWQKNLQDPVTEVAAEIVRFHDVVNIVIIAITLFVLALMIYVSERFNEKANPTPSRTTHHTGLEIAWTVIPILILVVIAVPSFKLLYKQYAYPPPDLTIKATGKAWFWEHSYPDYDDFVVASNMVRDEDVLKSEMSPEEYTRRYSNLKDLALLKQQYADAVQLYPKKGLVRQLSVDNEIAVPENKVVHVLVTAADVIHNWTIPSFGSKVDAVPGRVTATWFKATKRGLYFGQCSELCGKDHSSMPIAIRVVSQKAFDDWAGAMKAAKNERNSTTRRGIINRAREELRKASLEDEKSPVRFAAEAGTAN